MKLSPNAFFAPSRLWAPQIWAALALSVFLGVGQSACGRSSLNASFGQRLHAVQAAQLGAHPAREPSTRGDETTRNIQRYYSTIQPGDGASQGGGMGGAQGGPGMQTAGVSPLH